MKNNLSIISLLICTSCNSQSQNIQEILNANSIVTELHNDFNNDGVVDDLYVLEPNNKQIKDNITKRKLVILFKKKNNKDFSYYENDNVFPCRECSGKSDVNIDNLKFKNNLLSYRTCVAPFSSDKYSVIHFTLQFVNNNFNISGYKETYSAVELDENISITLNNQDFPKLNFDYYNWTSNKNWIDYITISPQNLTKINDFAYSLEKINPEVSIDVLQKILQKFPDRVVAYLNLGDSYWSAGNKERAKEAYMKYISLMKSQKKDLSKIPQRVYQRSR